MRALITGGAGFIGSNLAERLLAQGHYVTVIDNLSTGTLETLRPCQRKPRFRFYNEDLLNLPALETIVEGHDVVFHLAANSDILEGRRYTDVDLRLGTLATHSLLEAMRRQGVREILFSSSSAVYGEAKVLPTDEAYGPLFPISLYGASKLACEGLISAFCHNYGFKAWIFRFANICGRHGTHGVILDFIRKLQANPKRLEILGNGRQSKPYLHVGECIDGMLFCHDHASDELNCFNLGCDGATSTIRVARILLATMDLGGAELVFSGGKRGWPGDVCQVRLDCTRLEALGWQATLSSDEAVQLATTELVEEFVCRSSS
jgi:UDP-glucose 4-epimerase